MALAFPSESALRVAIASGLCPPAVQAAAATVGRDEAGHIVIAPSVALGAEALAALAAAGVATDVRAPDNGRAVSCWAEAVGLERHPLGAVPPLVVFAAPRVIDVAAELLRLGCDRQEVMAAGEPGAGLVRALDPPTYTVMRALDGDGGLLAYAPDPPGQEQVFTELPFRHPLAARAVPPAGTLALLGRAGWRTVPDTGWRGLDAALDLVTGPTTTLAPGPLQRRRIELRLVPGRREPASLWVIRRDAMAVIDRLLSYLPDELVARLAFAATDDPEPTVILRVRTSRHAPPELALDAEAYAALPGQPDVYAPVGTFVEPPLRRERLREVIGARPSQVMWLHAEAPRGPFTVQRIADAAFAPLADWAEYVVHASAAELAPWARGATFDFADYVSTGLEWSAPPPSVLAPTPTMESPRRDRVPRPLAAPPAAIAVAPAPPFEAPAIAAAEVSEPDAALVELEAELLALDTPADDADRLALLARLGTAYLRSGRHRDGALCFARVVWPLAGPAASAALDAWLAADLQRSPTAADLELALASPTPDHVRRVAVMAARSLPAVASDLHRVIRFLDRHDALLDVRSVWLARVALARLAGGDRLGLAQARDRMLARLAGGLAIETELPSALRTSRRGHGEQLTAALDRLHHTLTTTPRARSVLEQRPELTRAYTDFVFAHGYARLGHADAARELIRAAGRGLASASDDPVHGYLAAAFTARIEQVLAGAPPETPLPPARDAQLAALEPMDRYRVDMLRARSQILEPVERIEPGNPRFQLGLAYLPRVEALRTSPDRVTAIAGLLADAARAEPALRERYFEACLAALLELPEAQASPLFAQLMSLLPARAPLYADALMVAGHFAWTDAIPGLLRLLSATLTTSGPADATLERSLRALRRVGLRAEVAELLVDAERALGDQLDARIAIAGGLAFLGELDRALPILAQGLAGLHAEPVMERRLTLVRSLARAFSLTPIAHALAGIAELTPHFAVITDNFAVNSHYCLSVLSFVESLVLGITSDDLALDAVTRRFIEDDEHLIRRRLHHDLGGAA